jgi:hypothetical protein
MPVIRVQQPGRLSMLFTANCRPVARVPLLFRRHASLGMAGKAAGTVPCPDGTRAATDQ